MKEKVNYAKSCKEIEDQIDVLKTSFLYEIGKCYPINAHVRVSDHDGDFLGVVIRSIPIKHAPNFLMIKNNKSGRISARHYQVVEVLTEQHD